MKNSLLKVAVLIAVWSATSHCFAQPKNEKDVTEAKHFVESLYAQYGPNGIPPNLFETNANEAFTRSLIALAKADAAAAKPDVGALDYDPVCNCQDTDGTFPNLKINAEKMGPSRALATATFTGDNGEPNKILLTLIMEAGHWRIFNVENLSGPGPHSDLRTMLKKDIREISSKKNSR